MANPKDRSDGKTLPLLVEIGTEELPPKALHGLMTAFAEAFGAELQRNRLAHGPVHPFASPRRLALRVDDLQTAQPDRSVELKGPPVSVAFSDDGEPQPAALAFARKNGVEVEALERRATDKGEWLYCQSVETGAATSDLVAGMVASALQQLPVPRPMRWGDGEVAFVRPVHWVVVLLGAECVGGSLLGVPISCESRGHRFLAPGEVSLSSAIDYEAALKKRYVIADFDERMAVVRDAVDTAAAEAGGRPVATEDLYREVAALVEWPAPITGSFDEAFLQLPREVVVATLTGHQRYFPLEDENGRLLPRFITIANIESSDPDKVRDGNERVIRPRLADAAFFWQSDQASSLADRLPRLDDVVYQQGLGSMGDKARRVSVLAASLAPAAGADAAVAERAALLSKCDLLTGMVGEFPELQGTMGGYYAGASGESGDVAQAIAEHYRPAFAGDELPISPAGRTVALADKLDSLAGIFVLGKRPSGTRDPFGLRRAALGVVRLLIEGDIDLDLRNAVGEAVSAQPAGSGDDIAAEVYGFIVDRLRAYAAEQLNVSSEMFEAVRERSPATLTDFRDRLVAVTAFVAMDEAESLAAANKRIANILRPIEEALPDAIDDSLFDDPAEGKLYSALTEARDAVAPLVRSGDYSAALARLARLREPVDAFFDDVMVMVDDDRLRRNRLALLAGIRSEFMAIADISRLAVR